jgi:SnoaL-like domain
MSPENIEVVTRLLSLWKGVDGLALIRDDAAWAARRAQREAIYEPDCAFIWLGLGLRAEATGLDGLRAGWLDFFEGWESTRTEYEAIIPVGDKVVVLARQYGRIAGSRNEVENLGAGVYLVRGGRIARAEFYADRAEAFEAVRLRD